MAKTEEIHINSGYKKCKTFIDLEEAKVYFDEWGLKAHYMKNLNDGTPRRIWEIRDPKADLAGYIITEPLKGHKSIESVWQDTFDFMEVFIHTEDYDDPNTTTSPRTSHYAPDPEEEVEEE